MTVERSNTSIPFALTNIQTLEFAVIKELYSDGNPNVEIGINVEFGIQSLDLNELMCALEVAFLQEDRPFIKIKVCCHFSIKPEQWKRYMNEDKKSIMFPKGFTDHLLVITTGTLRGALHAKTEGTLFNRFLLPTINVASLSEDDIELKL
jgi:hypothetical protein